MEPTRSLRSSYPSGQVVVNEISDHLVAWIRGAQDSEPQDLDLSGNGAALTITLCKTSRLRTRALCSCCVLAAGVLRCCGVGVDLTLTPTLVLTRQCPTNQQAIHTDPF